MLKTDLLEINSKTKAEQLFVSDELYSTLDSDNAFEELFSLDGKMYRMAPGRRTLCFTRANKDYFLKSHSGVGWKEIFKNLIYLRLPVVGAKNEWDGIHHLTKLGVDTMTVSAYGTKGINPAAKQSFIVTEALPTQLHLEEFCASWKEQAPKTKKEIRLKRWLLKKVIDTSRTMHQSGMNHRDFYLCHFFLHAVYENDDLLSEQSKLFVIDLHRIQLRNKTPQRWLVKDIAALYFSSMDIGLSKRDLFRFIKGYSDKPLRAILNGRDMRFWNKVEKRAKKMYQNEQFKTFAAQDISHHDSVDD